MDKRIVNMIWIGLALIFLLLGAWRGLSKNTPDGFGRDQVWRVEQGGEGAPDRLVRGAKVASVSNDLNKLLLSFNRAFEEAEAAQLRSGDSRLELPHLRMLGTDGSTVAVEVVNGEYLSGRMGSSGAIAYLAAATYTLTERQGITAVDFRFPAGEHAIPGTYSRESFNEIIPAPGGVR